MAIGLLQWKHRVYEFYKLYLQYGSCTPHFISPSRHCEVPYRRTSVHYVPYSRTDVQCQFPCVIVLRMLPVVFRSMAPKLNFLGAASLLARTDRLEPNLPVGPFVSFSKIARKII